MSSIARRRNWLIAILVIPAAIYLFFFLMGARGVRESGRVEQLPETYLASGTPARLAGATYQAGTSSCGLTCYHTLQSGSNKIMPEPGLVFAVVPLLVPAPGEAAAGQPGWTLLDEFGRPYRPLATDPGRLTNIKRLGEKDILPGTAPEYLVFKVKEESRVFYLRLATEQDTLYWHLPPGS